MPQTTTITRRAAICVALARRSGHAPDASAVAHATLALWELMAGRLEPVIGARGTDALFNRSLHLVGKTLPWLWLPAVHGNSAVSLESLQSCLATREASVATDAGCTLLATFTELLASLVGESLTERLLGAVWLPSLPETQHEARA